MARRYNRDKYGRFAPKGSGATARGGRLKTASGKKRATQTMKAQSQQRSGTLTPGKKKPSISKPSNTKSAATNKVAASPRQLTSDQKIARDVMTDRRFRSDRQRRAEMIKRGINPNADFVSLVAGARAKQGGVLKAASNTRRKTSGKLGPKNAIKAGPKSPKTKIDRAIKDIKSSNNDLGGKLKDARKRVDAFKGKMIKADKSRAQKAFDKPSVTDKRSRDFLGKLTKEGRKQDPDTGGKKKRRRRR